MSVRIIADGEGQILVYSGFDVGEIESWERHGRDGERPTPTLQLDEEDAAELSIRLARAVYLDGN